MLKLPKKGKYKFQVVKLEPENKVHEMWMVWYTRSNQEAHICYKFFRGHALLYF